MSRRVSSWSRRDALRAGLATLALTPVNGSFADSKIRIAVIGAGLAGLSAARDLAQQGASVVVLEARERIGGRIFTSRLWQGMPMDLGASWIHGVKGNPLSALADEAGAARLATSYESSVAYDAGGRQIDDERGLRKALGVLEAARKRAEGQERDIALAAAVQASSGWAAASEVERRMIRHAVNSTVEQEYGGDWSEVSSWSYDDSKEFSGGDVLFPGGFDQITAFLAQGLDIRLGQVVQAIDRTAGGVRITLAGGETVEADRAVVTLPLGVLRSGHVKFGSRFAESRQAAIDTLRMGLLNKCWLRFDSIAWPDEVDWIEWIGPEDGVWAEWVSLAHSAKLPVLLGFNAGTQARQMEELDDAATLASAHEALKKIFGTRFPAPREAQVTRWSRDPFSLGSYSFNAVGVTPQTRRDLAGSDWEGRLFFAGEAASAYHFGTAHGAVLSGRAAAAEIARG